jgi:quercetin dioxygenase-like cupin family protein
MAIPHAGSGDLVNLAPLGAELARHRTTALVKTDRLELVRVVLPAGKSLPPHQVPGDITIQCIEGSVTLSVGEHTQRMQAGQLVYLAGGTPHGLLALEDASLLVTLVLH